MFILTFSLTTGFNMLGPDMLKWSGDMSVSLFQGSTRTDHSSPIGASPPSYTRVCRHEAIYLEVTWSYLRLSSHFHTPI